MIHPRYVLSIGIQRDNEFVPPSYQGNDMSEWGIVA